MKFSSYY